MPREWHIRRSVLVFVHLVIKTLAYNCTVGSSIGNYMEKLFRKLAFMVGIFHLAGCAAYSDLPPGTRIPIETPVVSTETLSVVPVVNDQAPMLDYTVGPGDVLFININGRPEYSVIGANTSSKVQGSRVDGKGDIHIPLVGAVHVAGLTISQVQVLLQDSLKKYLNEPWVVAEVAEYKSQPLYLLGQFKNSGTYYMDRPLSLMQGLAFGNGYDASANLRGARLIRNNKIVAVDIYDLLLNGDSRQNVWLKPGDSIYIPDNRNQLVFIFGAVKKPGAVTMPQGGLNLAQAIASAELRETGYDFRHVRIIRSLSTTRGELMIVDFESILRGNALPIQLQEGDIVYVPKSGFGTWNDVIAEILPSLTTISSILQPFVSIKFLNE